MDLERKWAMAVLFGVSMLTAADVYHDYHVGGSLWHMLLEAVLGSTSLWGALRLWKRYRLVSSENLDLRADIERARESEERWKRESSKHVEGLSRVIDEQFDHWKLTPAEKDVALLVLKGLGLKEIASLRDTSERTVRQQCLMVYQKSGLAGRAELSAFFLEDLLSPRAQPTGR